LLTEARAGKIDPDEHEGAEDETGITDITPKDRKNAISIRIPIPKN